MESKENDQLINIVEVDDLKNIELAEIRSFNILPDYSPKDSSNAAMKIVQSDSSSNEVAPETTTTTIPCPQEGHDRVNREHTEVVSKLKKRMSIKSMSLVEKCIRYSSSEDQDVPMETTTFQWKQDQDQPVQINEERYEGDDEFNADNLKAFNMFVRMFVDENLDRGIPISKQPKEKVQAILDACDRQFPNFKEKSRKRIRTYLKSCRRLRRTKDGQITQILEIRPTPAHLTSQEAEKILQIACNNESKNANRMQLGLCALPYKPKDVIVNGAIPMRAGMATEVDNGALNLSSIQNQEFQLNNEDNSEGVQENLHMQEQDYINMHPDANIVYQDHLGDTYAVLDYRTKDVESVLVDSLQYNYDNLHSIIGNYREFACFMNLAAQSLQEIVDKYDDAN